VFDLARADGRVTGGAITGSTAVGAEDRWSDVDTSFGIAAGVDPEAVLHEWTAELERDPGVVHWWDLRSGPTIYRVLLMPGGLELNIAATPAAEFGARGPKFRLLFGDSVEHPPAPEPDVGQLIGWGWVYALSARTAIERGKLWQAEHYVSAVRDHALACVRHGEPHAYGRGFDGLPPQLLAAYEEALLRSADRAELRRALAAATERFLGEVADVEPELAERLSPPLTEATGAS
jgi:hypothetical protein